MESKEIKVFENIMQRNDKIAEENKKLLKNTLCINIMSSPGAGKTTLLEKTLKTLKNKYKIGVIEGDVTTSNDAKRIKNLIKDVYQIQTKNYGGSCHLDASMINFALEKLKVFQKKYDIIIIENVGNLICPADFNLGEDKKVILLSITEGEDKPLKYPLMFQIADFLLLNKIDLLPYIKIDMNKLKNNIKKINSKLNFIECSALNEKNLDKWIDTINKWIKRKKSGRNFRNSNR